MISRIIRVLLTLTALAIATFVVLNRHNYNSLLPDSLLQWSSASEEVESEIEPTSESLPQEEELPQSTDSLELNEIPTEEAHAEAADTTHLE